MMIFRQANLCFNFFLISLYSSRYFTELLEDVLHFIRIYFSTPVSVIKLEGPPETHTFNNGLIMHYGKLYSDQTKMH